MFIKRNYLQVVSPREHDFFLEDYKKVIEMLHVGSEQWRLILMAQYILVYLALYG